MSEILDLASRLRQLDRLQLAELLRESGVSGQSLSDMFDLARALLGKRELERRIRKLSKAELDKLRNSSTSSNLEQAYLAGSRDCYPAAVELAKELAPTVSKKKSLGDSADLHTNYETQLALTEIIFSCERHFLEPMKQGLRSQDLRQLAATLKLENTRIQGIFQLGMLSGLFQESDGRYVATEAGWKWLDANPAERWLGLVRSIWDIPALSLSAGENLIEKLAESFPLLPPEELLLVKYGHLIGLLDFQSATALMVAATHDLQNAALQVAQAYPEPASRVLVQGDLSIITPGPVSTDLHRQLDLIAQSEDLGLACRFRISLNSIMHAMETGMNSEQIQVLLKDLAGGELPQPLEYLLAQARRKFGELTVEVHEDGSLVRCLDPIVITQILNETSLRGLMLRPANQGLTSRLAMELIYFNLRDAGYPAIMIDEQGKTISPRTKAVAANDKGADAELAIADSLLSNEKKEPEVDDHLRQLQFALKNKLKVGIRVEMPEGTCEFEMTPLGIAGGRFRGRDVEKEAERTLPLSRIQAVWLS